MLTFWQFGIDSTFCMLLVLWSSSMNFSTCGPVVWPRGWQAKSPALGVGGLKSQKYMVLIQAYYRKLLQILLPCNHYPRLFLCMSKVKFVVPASSLPAPSIHYYQHRHPASVIGWHWIPSIWLLSSVHPFRSRFSISIWMDQDSHLCVVKHPHMAIWWQCSFGSKPQWTFFYWTPSHSACNHAIQKF